MTRSAFLKFLTIVIKQMQWILSKFIHSKAFFFFLPKTAKISQMAVAWFRNATANCKPVIGCQVPYMPLYDQEKGTIYSGQACSTGTYSVAVINGNSREMTGNNSRTIFRYFTVMSSGNLKICLSYNGHLDSSIYGD